MNAYLYPALEAGPQIINGIIKLVPAALLDTPTHLDRFTPREVVAHLAHWESILRDERIAVPSRQNGVRIESYDEGIMATEFDYAGTCIDEQVGSFVEERKRTIELLQSLSREQLAHTMVHPERGVCTVMDLANTLVGHDVYHIQQLTDVISST